MSQKSANALGDQNRIWTLIIIVLFSIAFLVGYLMIDDAPHTSLAQPKIDLPADKIQLQDVWMTKVESTNQLFDQKLRFLEDPILSGKKEEQSKIAESNQLRQEISHLKNGLRQLETNKEKAIVESTSTKPLPAQTNNSGTYVPRSPSEDPFVSIGSSSSLEMSVARPPLEELVMVKAPKEAFNVDQAIPSGTSVRAVLVSSIDAPCGLYACGDPQPVKLPIIDDGHLPKDVLAKLKGGLVIASAYGDISTERVFLRLERLTLVQPDGDFIETEITGFVSGEDGKYGLRGTIVDKSCKLVANATYSGFFSGVGQFLNTTVVAGASQTNCCGNGFPLGWEMLQTSGLQGTCNAFDTLADYYIRRAEQIVPVVEVTAGRIVDITFTHMAKLGDSNTQEKVREIRQQHIAIDNTELRKRRNHGQRTFNAQYSDDVCRKGSCPRKAS